LGIPVPPIFVFQTSRGAWELVDGLQRLSTIFEFAGVLKRRDNEPEPPGPVALLGTNFLPDLEGKTWNSPEGNEERGIGATAQLSIKRARIRVEILKKESDPIAKYELFQRLNTGGTELSEQEVRNCTALMINPDFHTWLKDRSVFDPFVSTPTQRLSTQLKYYPNTSFSLASLTPFGRSGHSKTSSTVTARAPDYQLCIGEFMKDIASCINHTDRYHTGNLGSNAARDALGGV